MRALPTTAARGSDLIELSKLQLGDERITIRQLLNHTSGVFDWPTDPQSPFITPYREIEHARVWTQDDVLDELAREPYFAPGQGWHYSTTNDNLLKIIAERLTGTTALLEMQRRFLGPLGLHTLALDVNDPIPPYLERVYSWIVHGDGERQDISGDSEAWIRSMSPHVMVASALDLAKWCQALYGGRVLSEASLKDMLDFHRSTPDEPPVTGYGLGIEEIAVARLLQSYGHLGYHCGTMSAMLYLPKLKASLVVLANENNHSLQ